MGDELVMIFDSESKLVLGQQPLIVKEYCEYDTLIAL
jgi:hypothetical protein